MNAFFKLLTICGALAVFPANAHQIGMRQTLEYETTTAPLGGMPSTDFVTVPYVFPKARNIENPSLEKCEPLLRGLNGLNAVHLSGGGKMTFAVSPSGDCRVSFEANGTSSAGDENATGK